MPVNGRCAAPPGNCPDGTAPVNGQCNGQLGSCAGGVAPDPVLGCPLICADGTHIPAGGTCANNGGNGAGACPDGSTMENGFCYANCPDGTPAVNGRCAAGSGTCPNGSVPVNGQCPVGGGCDPATDPNHCAGNNNNAGGGGTCTSPPFCSGDLIACATLTQEWRTTCAVDALTHGDQPSPGDYGDTFTAAQAWAPGDDGTQLPPLDGAGWLGGNEQCPALPTVTFMDHSFDVAQMLPCSALAILSQLILLAGYVQAAYILGKR